MDIIDERIRWYLEKAKCLESNLTKILDEFKHLLISMLNIRFHQVHQPSVDPGMIADGKCLCWSSMHRPAFVWLFRKKLENVLRRKGLGIHFKRLPGMHSIFSLGCSNVYM